MERRHVQPTAVTTDSEVAVQLRFVDDDRGKAHRAVCRRRRSQELTDAAASGEAVPPSPAQSLAAVCLVPYRRLLVGMFLIGAVDVQYLAILPLQVTDQGLGRGIYAGLLSLDGLVVLAFELPATQLTNRWRLRTAITLGVGLIGAGISLMLLRGGIALLFAVTIVWTLGEVVSAPSATVCPALLAHGLLQGRCLVGMGASQSAGLAIGPIVATPLLEHGSAAVGVACAATGVLATVATWTRVRCRVPLGIELPPASATPLIEWPPTRVWAPPSIDTNEETVINSWQAVSASSLDASLGWTPRLSHWSTGRTGIRCCCTLARLIQA